MSLHHLFEFTILLVEKEQEANHILCCHSRAAWEEECEDQLEQQELASLLCIHDPTNGEGTGGESLLLLL